MAIPGLKPTFDVRAKVRIGEKKQGGKGGSYPSSVDYFISDDADFASVVGEGKKELRIFLPFQAAADNFSTGLEWWQGKLLACYSKGELEDGQPVALRKATMKKGQTDLNLLDGETLLSQEPVGQDRRKIVCRVRECPILKRGKDGCRPMGRLQFWIDGIDRTRGVFRLDTKSWNSIENLEATLSLYPDLRGVPFILRVEFTQQGRDRFPELYLTPEEAPVEVKNDADVALADALVQLRRAVDSAGSENVSDLTLGSIVRERFADALDLARPGWRENEAFIDRIKEVGVAAAAKGLLDSYDV